MPLLWLSLAFLCGVFTGWLFEGSVPVWFFAAAGVSAFLLLLCHLVVRRPGLRFGWLSWIPGIWPADRETLLPGFILPILPLLFLSGALRFQSTQPEINPTHLAWYNDQEERFIVEGVISEDPDLRDAFTYLRVSGIRLHPVDSFDSIPVAGELLARLPPGGDWRYGDRIRLEGRLRTPADSGDFSYRDYLAHQGIQTILSCYYCQDCKESFPKECAWLVARGEGSWLRRAIYSLRRKAHHTIEELFPDPESGLLAGIFLGIETGIPEELLDAFRSTGVSHIIAISGFNFAIVAGLFVLVFGRVLGRWKSLPAAWVGIAAYALLAGASPGVIRAAIMGSLSIFALRIGRRSSGLNTLAFVAMAMAVFDPHVLWDVGFQLSFMATLGLMLFSEPLADTFRDLAGHWFSPQTAARLVGPVSEYFLFTLAAQVTTLPLILYVFQQTSPVSLLANPLVLPAQPPLMVLGGLATLLGLLFRPLGQAAALFAWPWIAYTIRIVEVLAASPLAAWTVGPLSFTWMVGYYALLFGWTLWGGRLRELAGRKLGPSAPRLGWTLNLGLVLLTMVVWQQVFARPDGRLHLTLLDVGGGDGLLIQTPGGRSILVDGGPSSNTLANVIGRRLPFGSRKIDFLVVAATGERQLAALPRGLDRFQVQNVLWAGPKTGDYSARELQKRFMEDQIPVIDMKAGHVLDLGEGGRLEAIAVTRRGAVLLLEWQRFRLLLPIGLDFESMAALLNNYPQEAVTAMLLAEGGFGPLNPPEWIERWQPQLALISVEAGNAEGLPDAGALSALEGYPVLRTDRNGWIELSTDGERMWVEVERK